MNAWRWKAGGQAFDHKLKKTFRLGQVLERKRPELPERGAPVGAVPNDRARSGGYQHLPTVSGRGDARAPVHVDTDVVVLSQQRLTGVNAHPHAHIDCPRPRMSRERLLRGPRGTDGVACLPERDEEAIALGIDFSTAVLRERRAEKPPMIRQNVGVTLAELLKQTCRPFDVREEEGNGARRQVSH